MKTPPILFAFFIIVAGFACSRNPGGTNMNSAMSDLKRYRTELDSLRNKTAEANFLPVTHYFQFGMGNRTKLLYKHGLLLDIFKGDTLKTWKVKEEIIVPYEYMVHLITTDNQKITIREDSGGVWIYSRWKTEQIAGTAQPVHLPDFEEYRYPRIMRVLLHEILFNIVDGKPLPNLYTCREPLMKEAAMMAICLQLTGNTEQIARWVLRLQSPYDHYANADNLGETLYLISLFNGRNHPLYLKIIEEAKKLEVIDGNNKYISGLTDGHPAPVYQNKWLKFGLRSLNGKDDYIIPFVPDSYAALFWWDYISYYRPGVPDARDDWDKPYQAWACNHFHKNFQGSISNLDYPLSWERNNPNLNYQKMSTIDPEYSRLKIATPNSWHAAEMLLYLAEWPKLKFQMINNFF